MAAIAFLMAFFWITEAIPLAATSLFPIFLYPLFGILPAEKVTGVYMNSTIFLFLGGFLIAIAIEKWNLHRRIAIKIISYFGTQAHSLIFGFMLATAFLSMWISNTATSIMMLSIALALCKNLHPILDSKRYEDFSCSLMLSIAYSASIGGMCTLVGTPPNLSFARIYQMTFPGNPEVSFGKWMLMVFPLGLFILGLTYIVLTRICFPIKKMGELAGNIIENEKKQLTPINFEQKVILIVFILTAFMWMLRSGISFGPVTLPGWSSLLAFPSFIDDGTIAIIMAIILFLFPSPSLKYKKNILDLEDFKKVPWETLLLFGGGFALAKGFMVSGLAEGLGGLFKGLNVDSTFLIVLVVSFTMNFLTELTSNTATVEMFLPILASISIALNIPPLILMVPATLSASCAFMLPVATPPNAIIFGSGLVSIGKMSKTGFLLNLISVIVISLFSVSILKLGS